jgi:serine/threonine protein kinase
MEDACPTLYCASCLTTFGSDGQACPNMGCGRARPDKGWGRMYQPGEVVDRNYHVVRTLALGGAGVTYLVRGLDESGEPTDPLIALKLLFASRDHGAYLQRLATEAQILQQLDHSHIVQYLGFVHRTGQSPYLLTLFEEGGSLLDHMRRVGTLSIKAAAEIGRQVCWALEKGHTRDIIHRDLKPENMLLTEVVERDQAVHVRVADFGIAKVQGSLGSGLTRSGAFVGTPQYAAPEQFIGEAATPAADVYSLGAVLVFLMTARPVIKKAHLSAPEDVYLQLQDRLPATVQRTKDSEEDNSRMNTILAQAMQFEPRMRCSVQQLDQMLEALLSDQDPVVELPPSQVQALQEDPGISLLSLPPVDAPAPEPMPPAEPIVDSSAETVEDPTTEARRSATTVTYGGPAGSSADGVPPTRGSGGIRRVLLVGVLLGFLAVLGAGAWLGQIWWRTPWLLEGQPVLGGETAHSIVGIKTEKARIKRRTLKGKLRRVIRDHWLECDADKRPDRDLVVEVLVEPDGVIRWMKPVKSDVPASYKCVTAKARGTKITGWQNPRPLRARVRVEHDQL